MYSYKSQLNNQYRLQSILCDYSYFSCFVDGMMNKLTIFDKLTLFLLFWNQIHQSPVVNLEVCIECLRMVTKYSMALRVLMFTSAEFSTGLRN